jgi:type I restriction enzyme S subunit
LGIFACFFAHVWEQRKIGDISSFSKGEGFSKSDLVNQGVPVILYGQMYVNYQTIIRDVDTFVLPNKAGVVSTGHEVIIPASGETEIDIARASFVEKTGVFLGGDLNILKPNEGVDPAFLAIEISNGGTKKELSAKAQGKTIVHLHKDDIITLKICLPKDDEQKRISWFFDCFDHSIVLHQRVSFQIALAHNKHL